MDDSPPIFTYYQSIYIRKILRITKILCKPMKNTQEQPLNYFKSKSMHNLTDQISSKKYGLYLEKNVSSNKQDSNSTIKKQSFRSETLKYNRKVKAPFRKSESSESEYSRLLGQIEKFKIKLSNEQQQLSSAQKLLDDAQDQKAKAIKIGDWSHVPHYQRQIISLREQYIPLILNQIDKMENRITELQNKKEALRKK